MTTWIELADALRDATGPSRELDTKISIATGRYQWIKSRYKGMPDIVVRLDADGWTSPGNGGPLALVPHFTDTLHIGQIIRVIGEKLPGGATGASNIRPRNSLKQ